MVLAENSESEPAPRLAQRPRVLLSEQDAELRGMLVSVLNDNDCEVLEVRSSADLFSCLLGCVSGDGSYNRPDLVVSDLRLAGWSSRELLQALRKALGSTPVLLITAAIEDFKLTEDPAGPLEILQKPFDIEDLETRIEALRTRSAPGAH